MINGILFDLDGTLLDSAADLVAALNHVRESEGLPAVECDAYRRYASMGANGLLRAGMPVSTDRVLDDRKNRFLDFYARNSARHTRPFAGVESLLDYLAARAMPWGVVTNKAERLTLPILKETGLLHRAACVVCGDTLTRAKPHPAPVLLGCELLGLEPGRVLMVGDDLRDLQAGRAAGTQVAFAAYGYVNCGPDDVAALSAPVLDQPESLIAALEQAPWRPVGMA